MIKHTLGPWQYGAPDKSIHSCSGAICKRPSGYHLAAKNWEDNARLIAAAPDLLEALAQMMDGYELPSVRKQARAAIAKATGGVA